MLPRPQAELVSLPGPCQGLSSSGSLDSQYELPKMSQPRTSPMIPVMEERDVPL